MINGMTRELERGQSPAESAEYACRYLHRLGYSWDEKAFVATWIGMMVLKCRRKRWPLSFGARRIMAHVYRTAGMPPRLMPLPGHWPTVRPLPGDYPNA